MLKRFLRNLRQKPKAVRDNIALATAGIFTALVSTVWMYNFPSRVESLIGQEGVTKEDPAFTSFFGSMKEQLASLQQSVPEEEVATATPEATVSLEFMETFSNGSTTGVSSTEPFIFTTDAPPSAPTDPTQLESASTTQVAPSTATSTPRAIRIVTTNTASSTTATSSEMR